MSLAGAFTAEPASRDLATPARALAVGAHPDDIEFGAGATLARWAAAGCAVSMMICTDGSKGTWDPAADPATLVATRRDEARAAHAALGGTGRMVLAGGVDGELGHDRAGVSELARVIREVRPEVVLGHDPWRRWRLHPDHRVAGFLVTDAVVAARDPHFFAEHGLDHHRPGALLLFEADEADHAEDATGWAAPKLAALETHRSQFASTMGVTGDDEAAELAAFRAEVTAAMAEAGGWAGTELAEAFRRVPTDR